MAIVRVGTGIIDIKGSVGGVYFSRDKSGLHCSAHPRKISRRSAAQATQRNAFIKARAFSKDPRVVSFNIYRALNNLPLLTPTDEYSVPTLRPPSD